MKILHPEPGSEDRTSEAGSGGADAVSDVAAPAGDPLILRAMLDSVARYRGGGLTLLALVSELEFHLQSLIMPDQGWQRMFFDHWQQLDRCQSALVARGDDQLGEEARARVDAALEALTELVRNVLAGSDTR